MGESSGSETVEIMESQRDIQISLTFSYTGVMHCLWLGRKQIGTPGYTSKSSGHMKNSCSISGMCDRINSRKICRLWRGLKGGIYDFEWNKRIIKEKTLD